MLRLISVEKVEKEERYPAVPRPATVEFNIVNVTPPVAIAMAIDVENVEIFDPVKPCKPRVVEARLVFRKVVETRFSKFGEETNPAV